VLVELNMVL